MQGITTSSEEIRKAILEHPSLPLLFVRDGDAGNLDYECSLGTASAKITDVLLEPDDMWIPDEEKLYTSEEALVEDMKERFYSDMFGVTDERWCEWKEKKLQEYKPYWKECILVYVDKL